MKFPMKLRQITQPDILILSLFGSGFFPKAPGTFGTLISIALLLLIEKIIPIQSLSFIALLIFLTVLSSYLAERVQNRIKQHDPSWIVIDEFLGMATTWIFVDSTQPAQVIFAFLFFRFFDIVKIWPASFFDGYIKHGFGTIADDIVSGLYAAVCLITLKHFVL